jgi:hypothetical protein
MHYSEFLESPRDEGDLISVSSEVTVTIKNTTFKLTPAEAKQLYRRLGEELEIIGNSNFPTLKYGCR